jgi:putative proteasome-type protease
MTYCVGLSVKDGLVMIADTRTNAGIDNIATFRKLHTFEAPGERVMAVCTSGNLSVSQSVISMLQDGLENPETGAIETLTSMPSMFKAAQLIGRAIRTVYAIDGRSLAQQNASFDVSLLFGGQIKGGRMRLFMIYSAGNFIECTPDTPYLQIGEHKYGKPILDRAARYDTPLYDAIKLVLVSMDSTLRSNLSVGLPIDLLVYRKDACRVDLRRRIHGDDPYFRQISEQWSSALREAYLAIPRPDWARNGH